MIVRRISNDEAAPWVVLVHYAKRMPNIMHAFGAFDNGVQIGVVTYGSPPSPAIGRSLMGEQWRRVIELNRLVVVDGAPKNTTSSLVGASLRQMKKEPYDMVVSYADPQAGHVGYIYQATNFIYCGEFSAHEVEYMVGGKWTHARSLCTIGITAPREWAKSEGVQTRKMPAKHKYIYPLTKAGGVVARGMSRPYPKGDTRRYVADASGMTTQDRLF